jgi:hypothetical protein
LHMLGKSLQNATSVQKQDSTSIAEGPKLEQAKSMRIPDFTVEVEGLQVTLEVEGPQVD